MKSVEDELMKAAETFRYPGETDQFFRGRIVKKIDDLSTDQWEALTKESQKWFVEAAWAANHMEPLPPFPDPPGKGLVVPNCKGTIGHRVKELVLERPDISIKEVLERLNKEDYGASYAAAQVETTAFRAALKFLNNRGLLKFKL